MTLSEDGSNVRATSSSEPETFGGRTYAPIPMKISAITSSDQADDVKVDITVPVLGNEVAALFFPRQTEQTVYVRIHIASYDDVEIGEIGGAMIAFYGRVSEIKRKGDDLVLTCVPRISDLERPGLRRRFSLECPHQLFGKRCRASKAFATTSCSIQKGSANRFLINANTLLPGTLFSSQRRDLRPLRYEDFIGTEMTVFGKRFRVYPSAATITPASIALLNCSVGYDGPELEEMVDANKDAANRIYGEITMNCGRSLDFCHLIHENTPNFGGCPWIPQDNPVGRSFLATRG